jgi:hypothetical protein
MGVNYSHYIIPRDNTLRPGPDRIVALIKAWQASGYVPEHGVAPVFRVDAWEEQLREAKRAAAMQPTRPNGLFAGWLWKTPSPRLPLMPENKSFVFPPIGESEEALSAPGALIQWEIRDYLKLGTRYPLDQLPDPDGQPSYNLNIHLCDDFTEAAEVYGLPSTALNTLCACGQELKYETKGIPFEEERIHRACPACGKPFRPQDQIVQLYDGSTGVPYEERGGICYRFAIVVDCGKESPNSDPPRDPRADPRFKKTCSAALATELYEASHYS